MTDDALVERFLFGGAEVASAAFGILVRRHGPIVHGLCSIILKDQHEAEDAFQATFLVLARRAGSIRHRDLLPAWLLGVARRVAIRLKVKDKKRRTMHDRVARAKEAWVDAEESFKAEIDGLHEEIRRLPARYQIPVLLCSLEGMTYEQAAQTLGVSEGAIRGRLVQAKERLRRRLMTRGFTPEGVFPVIVGSKATVVTRAALIESTVRGLIRMTAGRVNVSGSVTSSVKVVSEEVIRAMRYSGLKIGLVIVMTTCLAGVGVGTIVMARGEPVVAAREATQLAKPPTQSDLDKLQGTWIRIQTQSGGFSRLLPEEQRNQLSIRGSVFTFNGPPGNPETARIEPGQIPKTIDLTPTGDGAGPVKGVTYFGIYALEGDTLMLGLAIYHPSERPKNFTTKPGSNDLIDLYRRVDR